MKAYTSWMPFWTTLIESCNKHYATNEPNMANYLINPEFLLFVRLFLFQQSQKDSNQMNSLMKY